MKTSEFSYACILFAVGFISATWGTDTDGVYKIGVGVGDITGPPAGIVLNGHINPFTYAAGIHTRQYARAFVVESITTGNVITYVTCDMGMIDHSMKPAVVAKLAAKFGSKYNESNILISGTHTHSGVSGFMTYFAYLVIESQKFNPISYWAAVDGIVDAITAAELSLQDGKIFWHQGELLDTNRNRRMDQYEMNPQEERDAYPYSVDKDMIILKFVDLADNPIGLFAWYPLHPLSFNQREDNPLVCSESTGYAAVLFDAALNPAGTLPGKGKFVSGFGSTNLGDVAPDNNDPIISPSRIDLTDDMRKLRNNGNKLFNKATQLFNDIANLQPISGPIGSVHRYVDTETIEVQRFDESTGQTQTMSLCKGALGFGYVGLDPEEFPFLETIRDLIKAPSEEMVQCQSPKIVALAAGEMDDPWQWAPSIVELQNLQLGSIFLAGVPGEFTTMAGRRVRNAIFNATGDKVIVAGLSNNYINYVATPEEYEFQEYEAGATAYGRNTLPVITTLLQEMAVALKDGTPESIPIGDPAPSFLHLLPDDVKPRADPTPTNGAEFGDVIIDVGPTYTVITETEVRAVFYAGSPRNSPMRKGTFLTVDKLEDGRWTTVKTDADVDTAFYWNLVNHHGEISWFVDPSFPKGTYRLRHFGYYRIIEDGISIPYSGTSSQFILL